MNQTRSTTMAMAAPPEGVLAGESVPRENTLDEREKRTVAELANEMKGRPGYAELTDEERRAKAREKLLDREVIA